MSTSASFEILSPGTKRWIYKQGWCTLREAQELAIPAILSQKHDVLITAPTAGGKTEAAFLPVISHLESKGGQGYGALCISPLKALINDQYNRLLSLCECAGTSITAWHGETLYSQKQRSWQKPEGVLLITPESLESLCVRRQNELITRIKDLSFVIVDEFHSFIDRQRGMQLLSLLARIECVIPKPVPRIALSATISDPMVALNILRPDNLFPKMHIDASKSGAKLQLSLKAYPFVDPTGTTPVHRMADDLFGKLRGTSNLIFANSRRIVEELSVQLTRLCEDAAVPLEFYPHHGSLSKESRRHVEERLKLGNRPTTAIATSTLELGIDIGDVASVAQIGAPANVSSIRQRLGRSGRRAGQSSTLRIMVASSANKPEATPIDRLEIELFQSIAVTELMLERWIEPPDTSRLHYSTMIQQILSMIAAKGDLTAVSAYHTLCVKGPWRHIDKVKFQQVLRALGASNVIAQLTSKELIIGEVGEQILSDRSFYTSFEVPEEYKLFSKGRSLGTLPAVSPILPGQLLVFAGQHWLVASVEADTRVIDLMPAKGGQAPIFGGTSNSVHKVIRQRMCKLYQSNRVPTYCDDKTQEMIRDARHYYREEGLSNRPRIDTPKYGFWLLWESDRTIETLRIGAIAAGHSAISLGPILITNGTERFETIVGEISKIFRSKSQQEIVQLLPALPLGKFDKFLSDELLREAYASETLDFKEALRCLGIEA